MMNCVRGPLLVTRLWRRRRWQLLRAWATGGHCGPDKPKEQDMRTNLGPLVTTVGQFGPGGNQFAHVSACGSALRLACACPMPVPSAPAARCAPGGLPRGHRHGSADAMASIP